MERANFLTTYRFDIFFKTNTSRRKAKLKMSFALVVSKSQLSIKSIS